jgi:hypothetical protein
MSEHRYIYCLVEPLNDRVIWVGCTANPQERYRNHIGDRGTWTEKGAWVNWLRAFGLLPTMITLEITHVSKVRIAETAWIEFMLSAGEPLMNSRDGHGRPLPWRTGDNWYKPRLRKSL